MTNHDEQGGGRLSGREVAFAARDAAGYLEALWVGDKERAGLIWAGADEREREAIAEALASIALTALRAPESTPPGRFVGIVQAMLADGVNEIDGAGW
ncbi:hypothetical protein FM103_02365 [Corynebacterium xerosis]|nr:hypothetical protein FM103_02365 [Corynebacterium xerosis]